MTGNEQQPQSIDEQLCEVLSPEREAELFHKEFLIFIDSFAEAKEKIPVSNTELHQKIDLLVKSSKNFTPKDFEKMFLDQVGNGDDKGSVDSPK